MFAVEGDGTVKGYPGGYTEYLEARRAEEAERAPRPAAPEKKADRPASPKKLKFSYKEQREYETIREQAARRLAAMGEDPGQLSAFEKLSTAVGVTMNTLTDKSARHMAEMLIQGSTMGIVDLTKAIRDNPGAGRETLALADRLLRSMQRDVEELKSYL